MFRSLIVALFALVVVFVSTSPASAAITHHGKVTAIGAGQITLLDDAGDTEEFDIDSEVKVRHNGKPATLGAIDTGDVAKVTLKTKQGRLVVVEIDARDQE